MLINVLEAKNSLSRLIQSAQAGEDVVIANRGKPVARLVPVESLVAVQASEPPKTPAQTLLEWLAANPLPPSSRRSAAEIEASIREERDAWE